MKADNRLILTGVVAREPEFRQTPAGRTIARFPFDHVYTGDAEQGPGDIRFRIWVRVTAQELMPLLRSLKPPQALTLMGHLYTTGYRAHDKRFEVHARRLHLETEQTD
ncbi:MAG: single-stranded DNA-binding protein [Ectothiorhodospiraceae bacterium]|nr:single-stranded DNA-binding protein [Ectothiorhodospiraceae bacterium]MCH8506317.1 single-stranded DNA-binding protein [Ectothiorhodospiraceae bacterium]